MGLTGCKPVSRRLPEHCASGSGVRTFERDTVLVEPAARWAKSFANLSSGLMMSLERKNPASCAVWARVVILATSGVFGVGLVFQVERSWVH